MLALIPLQTKPGPSIRPARPYPRYGKGQEHRVEIVHTSGTRSNGILHRHPTAVARIEQHRPQHMPTVGSTRFFSREGIELPEFSDIKPYPLPLPEREEYVMEFSDFDNPRHAQNFLMKKKLAISGVLVHFSLAAAFASAVLSAATAAVREEYHVGREVVNLGTSFLVLGYALGPTVFAPISKLHQRRLPLIVGAVGFGIFNTAVACVEEYRTLAISRFFSGFFGVCPLAITWCCVRRLAVLPLPVSPRHFSMVPFASLAWRLYHKILLWLAMDVACHVRLIERLFYLEYIWWTRELGLLKLTD
ncbi:hypothetical protein LTR37_018720 [Vermiconidia calcicola]|uniref:Uncharacterized protein n=1 Tax=Vermiconidia calcicola TaxID=1690605 RepID=A0ACC3MHG1_9PEZI|nr:hypothetical protein LTR37_018720 [Vermiconidia calcicola]